MTVMATSLGALFLFLLARATQGNSNAPDFTALHNYAQESGYVDVRPGAHMFYWLFHTTHAQGYAERPLIIWLQGGPGYSSTGHGNLEEIGPLDPNGEPRNLSWVTEASLLFVDSPVGVGFSYVDSDDVRPTSDDEMIDDLVTLITHFVEDYPVFKTTPIFIFGQSYGGKMAARFAWALHQAIDAGRVEANLQGVAMGNGWVSPIDSVLSWPDILFTMSLLDKNGQTALAAVAARCQGNIQDGAWEAAADCMFDAQHSARRGNRYVDFYHIMHDPTNRKKRRKRSAGEDDARERQYLLPGSTDSDILEDAMNGPVRDHLGTIPDNVVFRRLSPAYEFIKRDFMKPGTWAVENLLKYTTLKVVVYQGQMDVICATAGAYKWVDALDWPLAQQWRDAAPFPSWAQDTTTLTAFVKRASRFTFYTVLGAGHEVPLDKPEASLLMVRDILEPDSGASALMNQTDTKPSSGQERISAHQTVAISMALLVALLAVDL